MKQNNYTPVPSIGQTINLLESNVKRIYQKLPNISPQRIILSFARLFFYFNKIKLKVKIEIQCHCPWLILKDYKESIYM